MDSSDSLLWHFQLKLGKRTFKGGPLEDYKKNIRAIIEKAQAADVKVMILASKMIGEPNYQRGIKNKLTTDGCHMNTLGSIMMAKGVLQAFGLLEAKIAAAEKSWLAE